MKQTKGQIPDYGNWVPAAMMKTLTVMTAVLLIVELLFLILLKNAILSIIGGILLVLFAAFTVYMWRCRILFDFRRGGLMGKIHQYLVDHLDWDGNGTLLDIGCGAGALTIRCARGFPRTRITGMDYWGPEWSYAKEQCERNARLSMSQTDSPSVKVTRPHSNFRTEPLTLQSAILSSTKYAPSPINAKSSGRHCVSLKKAGLLPFRICFLRKDCMEIWKNS